MPLRKADLEEAAPLHPAYVLHKFYDTKPHLVTMGDIIH